MVSLVALAPAEDLAGFSVADFSAGALLALVILMILLGRLVPKSVLEKSEKEAAYWRDLANKAMEQNKELIIAARSGTQVAAYVQQIAQGEES